VILGLITPVRSWFGKEGFVLAAREAVEDFHTTARAEDHAVGDLLPPLRRIREAHREALAPVVRIQAELHPWVAFGIMPLFALANAGVSLAGLDMADTGSMTVIVGVMLGLVIGKPIGIFLASFITVKLGVCALPRGVLWRGILLVGLVGGIGFTMAIFIAGLAFQDASLVDEAKIGIFAGSILAGVLGSVLVARVARPRPVISEEVATAAV
jgi:NhaA family Na+:H+ antiporter